MGFENHKSYIFHEICILVTRKNQFMKKVGLNDCCTEPFQWFTAVGLSEISLKKAGCLEK